MDVNQARVAHAFHQAGYRLTQPRLAVLQVLREDDGCLDPKEIYQRGKAICDSLGLVTVYRTLEILTELGLVRRVHSEQHCHSYASAMGDRHYLICTRCHRVVEFPCDGLEDLIREVQRKTGYDVTGHLLELSGLCPDCRTKQGGEESG